MAAAHKTRRVIAKGDVQPVGSQSGRALMCIILVVWGGGIGCLGGMSGAGYFLLGMVR